MFCLRHLILFYLVFVYYFSFTSGEFFSFLNSNATKKLQSVMSECLQYKKDCISCFLRKAANTIEDSNDFDLNLLDGFTLKKNHETVRQPKILIENKNLTESERLKNAILHFLETHKVSFDLNKSVEEESHEGRELKQYGGYGLPLRRRRRPHLYLFYGMMALLGAYGLLGPLSMSTLTFLAGKALLASKMALLIVGAVILKKVFAYEDKEKEQKVKVFSLPNHSYDDGHHRDIREEYDRYSTIQQIIDNGAYKYQR